MWGAWRAGAVVADWAPTYSHGQQEALVEQPAEFSFSVFETDRVSSETFAEVSRVFSENYRDANLAYLKMSLGKLRFLAAASDAQGAMAGFALAEARVIDLPRLPASNVHLAGLCCVGMAYRRHGLFRRLEAAAMGANKLPPQEWEMFKPSNRAHGDSLLGIAWQPNPPDGWLD